MEVAGVVEFDEVADAIEGADESGWGTEIGRREEINAERADTEVGGCEEGTTERADTGVVEWEEIERSEVFSVDDELAEDAEVVEAEVKVEVGMMSAVRLAITADRGCKSPDSVLITAEEAAGGLKKLVSSAVVRCANVRSVVSKLITILQIGQHLMQDEKEDLQI
jgi:hypothetical protein